MNIKKRRLVIQQASFFSKYLFILTMEISLQELERMNNGSHFDASILHEVRQELDLFQMFLWIRNT